MKEKTGTKLIILFFIGYAIWFIFASIKRNQEDKLLQQGNKVTLGWIVDFGYSAGGASGAAAYSVKIEGEKYAGSIKSKRFCEELSIEDKNKIWNKGY